MFDAVEGALDEILADPELASLHNWVRSLWAKQEASEQAAQACNQAVLASGAP